MSEYKIICGDCAFGLKKIESNSIDLIVTSPPYADARKNDYGSVSIDKYVEWFLPVSKELYRVLKPTGSFILNIKEKVVKKQRHTYVLELILALKQQGWLWTEEYIWSKEDCFPGKWPNRFRDAWERCLHFNKEYNFKMNQKSVMIPMADSTKQRIKRNHENDKIRLKNLTKNDFAVNRSNWSGKEMVFPTNVLRMPTENKNKGHSAVFPLQLPSWFIKLFTDEGDTVLDPFLGSGTTCLASYILDRNSIGFDIHQENCDLSLERISKYREDKKGEVIINPLF